MAKTQKYDPPIITHGDLLELSSEYHVFALKSPLIKPGGSVIQAFKTALQENNRTIKQGDIIIIASKVFSYQQNRLVKLDSVTPSEDAQYWAQKANMDPREVELILQECNGLIYGYVNHALLTRTKDGLNANAGIDLSNAPPGYALLLPTNVDELAREFQKQVKQAFNVDVGVVIIDSKTIPLRRGTTGVALGLAGIPGVIDERGRKDLYGYTMLITTRAIADNLGTAGMIVMGETSERRPFAIVRGLNLPVTQEKQPLSLLIEPDQCLYFGPFMKLKEKSEDC